MLLVDLPLELLVALPSYLRNIEDFTNAASSCRTLRIAFSLAEPAAILRLATSSAPTFFNPHPWYLILATARKVSDWAIGNESHTEELCNAFRGGIDGLLDLCVLVGGLTMEEIRRLHLARFSTINPLSNKLDQIAGSQWYDTNDFWNGGVSEAWTVDCTPQRAAFQIMIYWELFGSTLRAYLEPGAGLPKFDLQVRLDYIKYCIPDWICERGYDGFPVLPVGPYLPERVADNRLPADQIALQHILFSGRWKRLWEKPMSELGPGLEDEWRQTIFKNACASFGLESMELIKDVKITSEVDKRYLTSEVIQPDHVLTPAWREKLSRIKEQISQLDEARHMPSTTVIGTRLQHPLSEVPDMAEEVYVCMAALWPRV